MHNPFNSARASLRIGLSRNGIALLRTSGWRHPVTALLADMALEDDPAAPELTAAQVGGRLDALLSASPSADLPVRVILADAWVRLFMVTPPHNTVRLSDCRAAAEMRFQALYGDPTAVWQIQADWDPLHPFLACAIPRTLLDTLQQAATRHRLKLTGIAPHFVAAWNRWHTNLNPASWFGVMQRDVFTVGVMHQQRLHAVRAASVAADAWQDNSWLPAHLAREALRLNLPLPDAIQLCGDLPGQWATHLMGNLRCTRLDAAHHALHDASVSSAVSLAQVGLGVHR